MNSRGTVNNGVDWRRVLLVITTRDAATAATPRRRRHAAGRLDHCYAVNIKRVGNFW
jgi:hypothetical protein